MGTDKERIDYFVGRDGKRRYYSTKFLLLPDLTLKIVDAGASADIRYPVFQNDTVEDALDAFIEAAPTDILVPCLVEYTGTSASSSYTSIGYAKKKITLDSQQNPQITVSLYWGQEVWIAYRPENDIWDFMDEGWEISKREA